jgi:small-conductance mechanosensitive channel
MSTITFDAAANSAALYNAKAVNAPPPLPAEDRDALQKALGDTVSISDVGRAMLQATQQVAAGKDPSQLSDAEKLEIRNTVQESLGLNDEQMAALDQVNAHMEARRAQQGAPGPDAGNQQPPSGQPSAQGAGPGGPGGMGGAAGGGAGDKTESDSSSDQSKISDLEDKISKLEQEISELQGKSRSDDEAKEQLNAKQIELASLQAELAMLEYSSSQGQSQAQAKA